jgi:hypothetical protein
MNKMLPAREYAVKKERAVKLNVKQQELTAALAQPGLVC